jgi:hypothetical protein
MVWVRVSVRARVRNKVRVRVRVRATVRVRRMVTLVPRWTLRETSLPAIGETILLPASCEVLTGMCACRRFSSGVRTVTDIYHAG